MNTTTSRTSEIGRERPLIRDGIPGQGKTPQNARGFVFPKFSYAHACERLRQNFSALQRLFKAFLSSHVLKSGTRLEMFAHSAANAESLRPHSGMIGEAVSDDWLQLSPFGEFPDRGGVQVIDRQAVVGIVAAFNALRDSRGRLFAGLPLYIGNPDNPGNASKAQTTRAYGWIKELEARDDGLYARVDLTAEGRKLKDSAALKYFRPKFLAARINGKHYMPVVLQSVCGFITNPPRIAA